MGRLKEKLENLEETNGLLKLEADQKLKYQNDYNEALKEIVAMKKESVRHSKQASTHQASMEKIGKSDAQCQTVILGSNMEQGINLTLTSYDS